MKQLYIDIQTEQLMILIEKRGGFYCFLINEKKYITYDKKSFKKFCRKI